MTNKYRIITAALLCVYLIAASSCASQSTEQNVDKDVTTAAESESTTETDYLATLCETKYDGRSFRIIAQHTETRPNFSEDTLNGDVINDALFERDRRAEELLGITIENLPYTDRGQLYTDVQKSISAQDDICDMIITSMSDGINKLAPNGYLTDLSELSTLSLHENWWCASAADNLSFEGHIYFTTGPISLSYYTLPVVVAFNQRLADEYSAQDIYSLVKSGEWTLDRLLEMTVNVSADLDNNEKFDQNDRYGWALENNVGNALFAAAGLSMISPDSDAGYVSSLDSQRAVETIQSISDKFTDKTAYFIGDDFGAADSCVPIFEDGRALFLSINMGYMMFYLRDMVDDYGIVPIPKYDASQDEYISYCNTWMPAGVAVPITNPDLNFTGTVMETLAYLSYQEVAPAVYDVTLREKVARDSDSAQMMDIIFNNTFFDVNAVFDFGTSSSLLRKSVLGKAENYVSSYEAIKLKTESALADMIEMYSSIE